MGEPFTTRLRVRYGECDMQGVVFNSHYLAYVDVAITELWRATLGSYDAMLERGVDIVVAEAQLRFHRSARFDDEIDVEVTVSHLGTTSIITDHRIYRDRELLVHCTIRHVLVDRETLVKTPIPDWLRAQLEQWTVASAPGPAPARASAPAPAHATAPAPAPRPGEPPG